jgi:hypothetical protein
MEIRIDNIEGTNFITASNVYDVYKQSCDRNDFELVLDGLILERYSDNEEIKNYIKSLPKENKRLATVSLLSDDNVLWSQINKLVKKKQSSYERLRGVYNLIKEYVKIADVDRKGKGEIHTPFKELAEPMVKLVEKYDPEFWKNKNHKVLDSSAGYGTFLILAAYKFMVGLKDVIEDEEERFKWIVENCLYYGELQARSVFSWLVALDPFDEYRTNIFWGDFLSEDFDIHMKEVWKIEGGWDLIIQNPPYQIRKEGFKKTQPLWHLFVHKSLTLVKENGYMVMVHPSGWRNVDGVFKETQLMMLENQILELNINDENKGLEMFGAETRFDFYIIKKTIPISETNIISQRGNRYKINISNFDFIPNDKYDIYESLLPKGDEKRTAVINNSSYHHQRNFISDVKDNIFIYPCVYTVKSGDNLNLKWSSRNDRGHFGTPKLIWSNFRIKSAGSFIDKNGEYCMSEFSSAIVDDVDKLPIIKKAFDTKKFRDFMEDCSVSDMSINRKVISLFKKDFWKEFI